MIKSKIIGMVLLLFLSSAEKPVWTIDYKRLNLPEHGKPVSSDKWATVGTYDKPDPEFHVHFTLDAKILIGFLH